MQGFKENQRVCWHHDLQHQGVFAEYATVPAHVLSYIPGGLSDVSAAALPCAGLTAYQGLVRKARIEAGQTVLVQGASGGAGGFAVQIARSNEANVIALTRPAGAARVKALGAQHVLDYQSPELHQQVREICPEGCLLYTSPSPRDKRQSRMPSSA